MEQWKFYKETKFWGGRIYEVSDQGNAKINGVLIDWSKRKCKKYYVLGREHFHRIVAELFVPNPNNYNEVDHINGDIHDNRASNLRWCNHKMNMNYSLARQHNSDAQKKVQKIVQSQPDVRLKISESNKGNKNTCDHIWLTNGIDTVFPHKDEADYYLNLGYHYGRK